MTFKEIEMMYRRYPLLREKIQMLTPQTIRVLSHSPNSRGQISAVEEIAVTRADIQTEAKIICRCLAIMTRDERLFIEYRYFQDLVIDYVALNMHWSRREIFRLRQSILAKSKWLLELPGTKIEQKTS